MVTAVTRSFHNNNAGNIINRKRVWHGEKKKQSKQQQIL